MESERWVAIRIKGYEHYQVSSWGRIQRAGKNSFRRYWINKKAYVSVALYSKGKAKNFSVARLVCQHFCRPASRPDQKHVAHWDGNSLNNYYENLRYATPKENEADKRRHGRTVMGEKHDRSIVNDKIVIEIRLSTETDAEIARRLGLTLRHVNKIRQNIIWKHVVVNQPQRKSGRTDLTDEDVLEIYHSTRSRKQLAADYNLSLSQIGRIKRGKRWGHLTKGR